MNPNPYLKWICEEKWFWMDELGHEHGPYHTEEDALMACLTYDTARCRPPPRRTWWGLLKELWHDTGGAYKSASKASTRYPE